MIFKSTSVIIVFGMNHNQGKDLYVNIYLLRKRISVIFRMYLYQCVELENAACFHSLIYILSLLYILINFNIFSLFNIKQSILY